MKKYICELMGTAVLVLFGCGTAVLTNANITLTALAFGLSIVALAYAIGDISGCHVNPAVSFAMFIRRKLSFKDFIGYVIAQILGAFVGAGILYFLIHSLQGQTITNYVAQTGKSLLEALGLGANGFGDASTYGVTVWGALVTELILTFIFIYTILGVTSDEKKSSVAGIVIGLTLTFVHILGISLTGTSVNPARSLAPAVILAIKGSTTALQQVWVFIIAPFVGSGLAALLYGILNKKSKKA